MRFFCPACWFEIPAAAETCGHCGADLAALDAETFERKLARALDSPEPMTARRAAGILGRRGGKFALRALVSRLRRDPDPFLAGEIAQALGRIGGTRATRVLGMLRSHPSVIVCRAAEDALHAPSPFHAVSAGRVEASAVAAPAAVRFTDAQRRHVGLILDGLVRETRERLDEWERSGASGSDTSTVRRALEDLLEDAEAAAARLGIQLSEEAPDPRRQLASWSSSWWSAVLDSRPHALRGYGVVDSAAAETLAPIVDRLAGRLLRIHALAEGAAKGP